MPMTMLRTRRSRLRERLSAEHGFTMILTMGVLMVVMLLSAAVFLTVQSDASLTRADLDGKRAYAAAQSGMQAYLYSLNVNASNSTWWETCSNDKSNSGAGTPVPVPGATTGATYSYTPVPANGATDVQHHRPGGFADRQLDGNAAYGVHRLRRQRDAVDRRELPDPQPSVVPLVHRL